jgi:hypothetical protein
MIITRPKRIIALLGDTHTGSRYAIFPPNYKTKQGNLLNINRAQAKLYEYWQDMKRVFNELKVDTIMHFGDHIEGSNRKELGRFLLANEQEDQKEAITQLMSEIVVGRNYYSVTGSGYHHSLDTDVTEHIAEKLKGKCKKVINFGGVVNMKIEGTSRVMHASHGESAAMLYRTMIMDREGLYHLAAQAEEKIPKADIIAHGHLHSFVHLHMRHQHLIGVPAWKMFTPDRIHLKIYPKFQPDIGFIILIVDVENHITVWDYKYDCPKIDDVLKNG